MIIEATAKTAIKTKLLIARNNVTNADEALDALVDAIYEVIVELLANATVTGVCPSGGGELINGKVV